MSRRGRRRLFLKRSALLGASVLLAGCGEDETPTLHARARAWGAKLDCSDVSGLFEAEAKTRTDNDYRQHGDKTDQFCLNCLNFVPPATEGTCGTCKTVRGPINPDGWCKQWTKARS